MIFYFKSITLRSGSGVCSNPTGFEVWYCMITCLTPHRQTLNEKRFHGLFSKKETSRGTPGGFVSDLKLRLTCSSLSKQCFFEEQHLETQQHLDTK